MKKIINKTKIKQSGYFDFILQNIQLKFHYIYKFIYRVFKGQISLFTSNF